MEEKIKEAALAVYHRKGFSGTQTRDITGEAGVSMTLFNNYSRRKDLLFPIIKPETFTALFP